MKVGVANGVGVSNCGKEEGGRALFRMSGERGPFNREEIVL